MYNGDAILGRTTYEKDLGVTFSADMKVSEQFKRKSNLTNAMVN